MFVPPGDEHSTTEGHVIPVKALYPVVLQSRISERCVQGRFRPWILPLKSMVQLCLNPYYLAGVLEKKDACEPTYSEQTLMLLIRLMTTTQQIISQLFSDTAGE